MTKGEKPDGLRDFLQKLLRVPKSELDKLEADREKRKRPKETA